MTRFAELNSIIDIHIVPKAVREVGRGLGYCSILWPRTEALNQRPLRRGVLHYTNGHLKRGVAHYTVPPRPPHRWLLPLYGGLNCTGSPKI